MYKIITGIVILGAVLVTGLFTQWGYWPIIIEVVGALALITMIAAALIGVFTLLFTSVQHMWHSNGQKPPSDQSKLSKHSLREGETSKKARLHA